MLSLPDVSSMFIRYFVSGFLPLDMSIKNCRVFIGRIVHIFVFLSDDRSKRDLMLNRTLAITAVGRCWPTAQFHTSSTSETFDFSGSITRPPRSSSIVRASHSHWLSPERSVGSVKFLKASSKVLQSSKLQPRSDHRSEVQPAGPGI